MSWVAVGVAAYSVATGMDNAASLRAQADLTRQIANWEAGQIDVQANQAVIDSQGEAARYQTQINDTIGKQRANLAAGNVDVNFGTASDIQTESKVNGFLNILDIKQAGAQKAAGLHAQAINTRIQGSMSALDLASKAEGAQQAGISGAINAGASGYARYSDRKGTTNSTPKRTT